MTNTFASVIANAVAEAKIGSSDLGMPEALRICDKLDEHAMLNKFSPCEIDNVSDKSTFHIHITAPIRWSVRFGGEICIEIFKTEDCTSYGVSRQLLEFAGDGRHRFRIGNDVDTEEQELTEVTTFGNSWVGELEKAIDNEIALLAADHMEFALELFGAQVERQALQKLSKSVVQA